MSNITLEEVKEDVQDFIQQADDTLKEAEEAIKMFKDIEAARNRADHLLKNFDQILADQPEMTREEFDEFFVQYVSQHR